MIRNSCRCCGVEQANMKPLFGASIDSMLRDLTQLEVYEDDELPQKVCLPCLLQISRSFAFKETCHKTDSFFRAILNECINQSQDEITNAWESKLKENLDHIEITITKEPVNLKQLHEALDVQDVQDIFENSLNETSTDNLQTIEFLDSDLPSENNIEIIEDIIIQAQAESPSSEFTTIQNENKTDCRKLYECNVCKKKFHETKVLLRHHKVHLSKRFKCTYEGCDKLFVEKCNMVKHLRTHTGELRKVVGKPYLCSDCGKRFKWRSSLTKHLRHHTKSKIFQCQLCPKYYVELKGLKLHERTHDNNREYKCNECSKCFLQKGHLNKHFITQHSEPSFRCSECPKIFALKSRLVKHMERHADNKLYQCKVCELTFPVYQSLAAHTKAHTKHLYTCSMCPRTFKRENALKLHEKEHSNNQIS